MPAVDRIAPMTVAQREPLAEHRTVHDVLVLHAPQERDPEADGLPLLWRRHRRSAALHAFEQNRASLRAVARSAFQQCAGPAHQPHVSWYRS